MRWQAEVVYLSGAVEIALCPTRRTARAFVARVSDWKAVRAVAVRRLGRPCGWKQFRR